MKTERIKYQEDFETYKKKLIRFENLFSNLHHGVLVEDNNRKILYANQSFCDMFGIPSPELIVGMDCGDAARASANLFLDPANFLEKLEKTLTGGKTLKGEELWLKDGRVLSRDYVVTVLEEGVSGNMWLYEDITAKKISDENIKQNNQQWELLFSQS
ncbi:MAG: PAS domain-containing protein, partial [Bacteroidota bacterium]